MRLAPKVTMNPRRELHYRLVVASAGAKGPPPCFEAQGLAVQRPQRPLLCDLRPVVQPDFIVCLDQPSRFQSWLTRGDHIASADDRFLKATAIEQRFIQVEEQSPNCLRRPVQNSFYQISTLVPSPFPPRADHIAEIDRVLRLRVK